MIILKARDDKITDLNTQLSPTGYALSVERWGQWDDEGWRLDRGAIHGGRHRHRFKWWLEDWGSERQLHVGHSAFGLSFLLPLSMWVTGDEDWVLRTRHGPSQLSQLGDRQQRWMQHWHTHPLPCSRADLHLCIKRWIRVKEVKELLFKTNRVDRVELLYSTWHRQVPLKTEGLSAFAVMGAIFKSFVPATTNEHDHWLLERTFEPRVRMFCKSVIN